MGDAARDAGTHGRVPPGAARERRRPRVAAADVPLGKPVRRRAAMGGALLEEGDRGGSRDGVPADGVGVRARRVDRAFGRRAAGREPEGDVRGRVVPLDGRAAADPRARTHRAVGRAASGGLDRAVAAGDRHRHEPRFAVAEAVVHRAAHVLLRRRHGRDDRAGRADPRARARGRHVRPPQEQPAALHREPARLEPDPRAPASRHRAGRDRLGRVFPRARRRRLRRRDVVVRVRVGRPRGSLVALHARRDPALRRSPFRSHRALNG
ncbi:hypothetical protein F01_170133 [Burkholderia cenocepacia]|nr:hypothetical protein F01_170133 [Burkholderia cenocepacia]